MFICAYTSTYVCINQQRRTPKMTGAGWLWLVGSLKLQVAFAKEPYQKDYILQKRPMILRSLLIVATSYQQAVDIELSRYSWIVNLPASCWIVNRPASWLFKYIWPACGLAVAVWLHATASLPVSTSRTHSVVSLQNHLWLKECALGCMCDWVCM